MLPHPMLLYVSVFLSLPHLERLETLPMCSQPACSECCCQCCQVTVMTLHEYEGSRSTVPTPACSEGLAVFFLDRQPACLLLERSRDRSERSQWHLTGAPASCLDFLACSPGRSDTRTALEERQHSQGICNGVSDWRQVGCRKRN